MDIGSSVFECAQSYVALSRVKTLGGLYLKSFDPRKIRADTRAVEYYRKLGETRSRILAERERRAREQPVAAFVEPRNPTLSRYFVSNQHTAPISPDTENAKRGGSGGFLEEEEDYTEVATEVADYMQSAYSSACAKSDVKVIDFSQYAYRGR